MNFGCVRFVKKRRRTVQYDVAENGRDGGLRLSDGCVRLEPAEHDDPPVCGISEAVLVTPPFTPDAIREGERHEEILGFAGCEIGEVRVSDANNCGGGAIE